MSVRNNIFISYSHLDSDWLNRFNTFLKPLVRSKKIEIWDDTRIKPGQNWRSEIKSALDSAQIAIILVTPNFLASDFIIEEELPTILRKASDDGLVVLWISVSFCLYSETQLANYQAVNNPSQPLDTFSVSEQNFRLLEICKKIKEAIYQTDSEVNSEVIDKKFIEIAPDDWDKQSSLLNRLKVFFK